MQLKTAFLIIGRKLSEVIMKLQIIFENERKERDKTKNKKKTSKKDTQKDEKTSQTVKQKDNRKLKKTN